jgi:hypothetical protein
MSIGDEPDLTVLDCYHCTGANPHCLKCKGTGSIFWVGGYSFPYTPEGEIWAKREAARDQRK